MDKKLVHVRDLKPGDYFDLWGSKWRILEKISDGYVGDDGRVLEGVVILSLDGKEVIHVLADMVVDEVIIVPRQEERKERKLVSEIVNRRNPHLHKGLYISLVLLVLSLTLGIIAFSFFIGH